jgi:nucleotide-binding universal stress UspA family protein
MEQGKNSYLSALFDFTNARRKASLQEIIAHLTGKSNELLSYEEVAKKLKLNIRTERGVHEIPVKAIIGSVGRYTEFTRDFLPRRSEDRERWARVKSAVDDPVGSGLPPIDVYKVGEVYFVLDGNHRVSIARDEGFEFIEAHVIEVKTDVPITSDIQPDDLIIKSEYADFLEQTNLATLRPGVNLSVSVPGQYETLMEHIQVHRYFMGKEQKREIPFTEAAVHWYDTVYLDTIEPTRERGLCRWFPGRTETDLYLWVSEYRTALENELGWSIRPEVAVTELAFKENTNSSISVVGSWRTVKMFDRYLDRLFIDILIPITSSQEGWQALEQAISVAQRETATLHGLHIISPRSNPDSTEVRSIQERFRQRCEGAKLTANLAVEQGNIAKRLSERALLTDLVILNVSHPPLPGLSSLHSGLRSLIWRCARPILAVPGIPSPMDNALLAFDGSAKSKEALFIAAYLVEKWKAELTVLTIQRDASTSVQDYARSYLELHEINANYVVRKGSFNTFIPTIQERQINLVLMGGYSGNAIKELIFGSTVNYLLRQARCPLLICR